MSNTTISNPLRRPDRLRSLCLAAVGSAVIAILAQITIPLPLGVPLTLQTFAVLLFAIVLGSRIGTYAVLLYLLLGAVGLPVFAGFTGGIAHFAAPSGGFLLSFPLMAFLAGMGGDFAAHSRSRRFSASNSHTDSRSHHISASDRNSSTDSGTFRQLLDTADAAGGCFRPHPHCRRHSRRTCIAAYISLAVTLGAALLLSYTIGVLFFCLITDSTIKTALIACVLPFLPIDFLKTALAAFLGMHLRQRLSKQLR